MEEEKADILIVEDDLDIADMLKAYFRVQGYEAEAINWGEECIQVCQAKIPDLIILDIRLPDIDGFEVARQLRSNRRTQNIPIIFLTEKRERMDRLKGLELHAEDYITKPFDIQELRLRVRNSLLRSHRSSLTNPITGIPEGSLVDEHLAQYLSDKNLNLLCVSLHNLDQFKEMYGFVASDDLLRAVSLMLQDSLQQMGSPDDFIGHLSSIDFVILTRLVNTNELQEKIRRRLEQSFEYFYRHQDRESDHVHDHMLSLKIFEIPASQKKSHDIGQLKTVLEQLYRQVGS